jgi:uncharacterized protein (TIGR02611 family)
VGFFQESRNRLVIRLARAQLGEAEDVVAWTRARHPRRKLGFQKLGFLYVTPNVVLVRWGGAEDEYSVISWQEIQAWGLNSTADGGPILAVKTESETHYVQIPSLSHSSAEEATALLREFGQRVPNTREEFSAFNSYGQFGPGNRNVRVRRSKRGVAGLTKRISVTVLGSLLVIAGLILSLPLVPGPGILVLVIGLAVLGSEYDWASDTMHWAKDYYQRTRNRIRERKSRDKT